MSVGLGTMTLDSRHSVNAAARGVVQSGGSTAVDDRTDQLHVPAAQVLAYFGFQYRQEGRDAWLLCPLHEESTPSCHVDLISGRWYCHGCQRGGRLEDLVTAIVHDPLAALGVIRRARRLTELTSSVTVAAQDNGQPNSVLTAVDPLVRWRRFRRVDWMSIDGDHPVASYMLRVRGFWRSTLEGFDVRLTDWDEYPVVFPLLERDRIVGYVRRRITEGEPKYLYNAGFDAKERVVYYSIDDAAPCLLVEGLLDMMKAAQWGSRRVAALLGWRVTQQKVRMLEAFGVRKVICATDNTPTGEQGWELVQACFRDDPVRFKFPAWRKDVGELSQYEFLAGLP